MKSKITMLIAIGALALSASAPSVMAVTKGRGGAARTPLTPTTKSVITKKQASQQSIQCKKLSCRAAVPPHAILPGPQH